MHQDEALAVLVRDSAEIHLWEADDDGWRLRPDLVAGPVVTGAETFLAGTASCRIEVDDVDVLHGELTGVLHPTDTGSPVDTDWGTRARAVLDLDGNLLTLFQRR
ncbi:MAG: ble [Frankiales bacterium]|nr:ble [Frankiales bacterium]